MSQPSVGGERFLLPNLSVWELIPSTAITCRSVKTEVKVFFLESSLKEVVLGDKVEVG